MDAELRERAFRLIWNTPDPRGEDGTVIADNWIDAVEPINAILDALAPIIAEIEAAARADEREYNDRLRGAISWLEQPFVDEHTPDNELRARVKYCIQDAERAAAIRAQKEPSA
jgi:hypothetical protein